MQNCAPRCIFQFYILYSPRRHTLNSLRHNSAPSWPLLLKSHSWRGRTFRFWGSRSTHGVEDWSRLYSPYKVDLAPKGKRRTNAVQHRANQKWSFFMSIRLRPKLTLPLVWVVLGLMWFERNHPELSCQARHKLNFQFSWYKFTFASASFDCERRYNNMTLMMWCDLTMTFHHTYTYSNLPNSVRGYKKTSRCMSIWVMNCYVLLICISDVVYNTQPSKYVIGFCIKIVRCAVILRTRGR